MYYKKNYSISLCIITNFIYETIFQTTGPSLRGDDRHTVTYQLGQLPLGAATGSVKPVKALNFLWGQ